jgi:hypothetical protein
MQMLADPHRRFYRPLPSRSLRHKAYLDIVKQSCSIDPRAIRALASSSEKVICRYLQPRKDIHRLGKKCVMEERGTERS